MIKKTSILLFFIIILPVAAIACLNYFWAKRDLTEFILARREAISALAASTLEEKLNRLSDLASSISIQSDIQRLIEAGKWEEGIERLSEIPQHFPSIDRIFLADPQGVLKGDIPYDPAIRDKNLSSQEWYQKIIHTRKPYISNVRRRIAKPQINVIDIAHTIEDSSHQLLGIIVLQVPIRNLFLWSQEIHVGPSGFIYIVDRNGNLVAHPKFFSQNEIVSFASAPVVQRVLAGKRRVEVLYNPIEKEERIVAYTPVTKYGWGVVAQQPTSTAWLPRKLYLAKLEIIYGGILLFTAILSFFIVKILAERKKNLEALQSRTLDLQAANQDLEAFSYSVSHDLRNPLFVVSGYSHMLVEKNKFTDPEANKMLTSINRQVETMNHLIDDLLVFSHLGRKKLIKIKCEMDLMVRSVVEELKKVEKNSATQWSIHPLPNAKGDPTILRQVWMNLLSNALKFSQYKGTPKIEVGGQINENETLYYVRDNGIGIPMEHSNKIFGVFQRLHDDQKFEGTGIGLAIVERIIQKHGGRVWVESQLEKGSTFYFTLPSLERSL